VVVSSCCPGRCGAVGGCCDSTVWAYLAAGVVVVLIGLSFAEASTMYDRTGGPLVHAEEAMGKTAGFTVGWTVCKTLQTLRKSFAIGQMPLKHYGFTAVRHQT
jgi:amino acid permease